MSVVKLLRMPGGFVFSAMVFVFGLGLSMQGVAQPASGAGSPNAALEALAQKWNDARNKADMPALIAVFHPSDRPAAEVFYAGHQPASVTLRVLQVSKIAGDRYEIQVERSWGGSRPGKQKNALHASELNGEWFLRIPGGSLTLPPGKLAAVKPAPEPAPVTKPAQAPAPAPAASSPPVAEKATPAAPAPIAAPPAGSAPPSVAAASPVASTKAPEKAAAPQAQPAAKAPEKSTAEPPVVQKFDSWVRICEGKAVSRTRCFLEASLASAADKKPIMRWRVQVLEDGGAASLVLLPADVTLAAGLTLSLSKEQPTTVPFRACGAGGCEVRFNMEPQLLTTVTQRDTVPVKFVNQAGASVDFAVPMKGFKQAVNSLGKSR